MDTNKEQTENKKLIKGKKLNMSQIFSVDGKVIPVTLVKIFENLEQQLENSPVIVEGTSKGKGFAGVMKRWNFAGGPATRGQSDKPRSGGSIGAQSPGRVFKGKKMAGRMGNKKVSIKGLKILKIDNENNVLFVSGPVPGARNSDVILKVL